MQTQNYEQLLALFPESKEKVKDSIKRNISLLKKKAKSGAYVTLGFEKFSIAINSPEDLESLLLNLGLSKDIAV